MAGSPVIGVGPGIIVLVLVWLLALLGAVVLGRKGGITGAIGPLIGALLITLILVFIPRRAPDEIRKALRIIDKTFIPKLLVLLFIIGGFCGAVGLWCKHHAMVPVVARPLKTSRKLG